jgi:hypothetical protein
MCRSVFVPISKVVLKVNKIKPKSKCHDKICCGLTISSFVTVGPVIWMMSLVDGQTGGYDRT